MILSFHPMIEGDVNRLCAGRDPGPEDRAAMACATAILLPQGCRETLYRAARRTCPLVFPNYDVRFAYPGKIGQIRLFQEQGLMHPESLVFIDSADFRKQFPDPDTLPITPPLVVKRDWGGEGQGVFPTPDRPALKRILTLLENTESGARNGFVIQRFIPTRPRVLRVVVIGRQVKTYWRVMTPSADPFVKVGLALGGRLDYQADLDLMAAAEAAVSRLCRTTGIDLAAFDILFANDPAIAPADTPIFLEINYFFGRRGIGGSEALYTLLRQATRDWLERNQAITSP
jgi:ribosomal protein S6--L-glutamate ligase